MKQIQLPPLDYAEQDHDKTIGSEGVRQFMSFHVRERQLLDALAEIERLKS